MMDDLKKLRAEFEELRRREIADRVIISLLLQAIGIMAPAARDEIEKKAWELADKMATKDPHLAGEIEAMLTVIRKPHR